MKLTIVKAALLSCLWASLSATATPVFTTYTGTTAVDTYAFTLAEESAVTIGYSWSDMLLTKNGGQRFYDAASLGWTLTGSSTTSGLIADPDSVNAVSNGVLNLGTLGPGSYVLSLTGIWSDVELSGNGNIGFVNTAGTVDLIDGDQVGNVQQSNTFQASRIVNEAAGPAAPAAQIPEPQSLIMLLSGLGLLAASRRRTIRRQH